LNGDRFIRCRVPRGTEDYLPKETAKWRLVEETLRKTFEKWGYREVRTPTFEFLDTLSTGIGKELEGSMFRFKDKKGRWLALRAEMTTPIARVAGTKLIPSPKPVRLYYIANMFRYDEPQAGRKREFWHAGIELIGSESTGADAEVIALMMQSLKDIGLKNVTVRIGNVGVFKEAVRQANLSRDLTDKIRVCIDKGDREDLSAALDDPAVDNKTREILLLLPELKGDVKVMDKLTEVARSKEIDRCIKGLKDVVERLEYYDFAEKELVVDLGIIRGLEYYTDTVFEGYVPELGVAVGAGGRYDKLVQEFGGSAVPATGFAIGMDRCIDSLKRQRHPFPARPPSGIIVLAATDGLKRNEIRIASLLRGTGIPTETNVSDWDLSRGLSYASRVGIPYAVILGESEFKRSSVIVRDMKLGKQVEVKIGELESFFRDYGTRALEKQL